MPIRLSLDHLLDRRGMTLSDLASRIGITEANLSRIKTGKIKAIRFSTLEALCEELDCQPSDIIWYDRH